MSTKIETLELEILANSTGAKSGLDALTSSLTKLKNATKSGLGLSAVSKEVSGLNDSMNKMSKSSNKGAGAFSDFCHRIELGIGTIKSVAKALWSTVESSSDYTETLNLFNVSMGDYATQAKDYAEAVSDVMGIDTREWMEAQGIFMTLATGFGVASDRAHTMSRNLTQLSYDLASFYNMDVDTAFLKLKSGLAGELEPLRAIGYDLSQAKLEATALELGIDKAVSAMTQAEKAELRYYAIMTQVTETHGDMARTLTAPANQLRVFKAEVNMAAREIGNLFIPVLNAMLPPLIAVTKVIGSLAKSIAGVFGIGKEESPTVSLETAIENLGIGTETATDNTGAMTDNIEESQKAAKKLKSYLLGIDELNIINPNTDSAEDGSSFTFPVEDYTKKFTEGLVESKVDGITEKMKEWLGISEDIKSVWDLLATNFGNILVSVGLITVGIAAWKIGALVTDAGKLATFMAAMSRSMTLLGIALKAMGAAAVIAAATAGAVWLFKNTESTLTKIGAIVSGAALAVGAILAVTGNLPLGIALMAVGAVSMGSAIALNTSKLSDEVKNTIGLITGIVSGALLAVGAILAMSGVGLPVGMALMLGGVATFATAVVPKWDSLTGIVKGVISTLMAIIGAALLVIGIILLCAVPWMPLGIGLVVAGAAGLATAIVPNFNAIVDVIKTVFGSLLAIVSGALMVVGVLMLLCPATMGLGLAILFAGMAGSFAAFKIDDNPITNFVKKMCNGILNIINKVIDAINEMFHIKFDGLQIKGKQVIDPFNIKMLNIARIPLLAEGAYDIPSGQMFIAREAGAEMVGSIGRKTAVANNDDIVASVAGGVASANEEQNVLLREQNSLLRAILEKDSGVYLDGKNLTNSVEKYQRERGRVLIKGGVV